LEYYQDKMQPAFLPELRRRVQILSRAEELLDDKGELIKEAESKCASIVLSCERSLKEKGYDADWFVLYLDANYALAWAMAGTGKLYEDQILLEEMLDVSSSEASDPRVAEALRILRDKENIGYLRELFVARPYLKAKAQKMLGDIYLIQGYSVADFDDQGKYFQEALEMYNGAKAVNPFDSELDERIRKAEEAIKAHKQHGISISGVQELINAFGRNQ
jgi:tetratricopeptide (TPR) repeat protein